VREPLSHVYQLDADGLPDLATEKQITADHWRRYYRASPDEAADCWITLIDFGAFHVKPAAGGPRCMFITLGRAGGCA